MNTQDQLEEFCRTGQLSKLKELIENNTNYFFNFNQGLELACVYGHLEVAKLLVSCGASDFNRALYYACVCDNLEIIRWLTNNYDINYSEFRPHTKDYLKRNGLRIRMESD